MLEEVLQDFWDFLKIKFPQNSMPALKEKK